MGQLTPHQVLIQRFVELHPEEVARQLDVAEHGRGRRRVAARGRCERGKGLAADGAT